MILRGYTLPILVSLILHGAVFGVMLSHWQARPEPSEVQQPRVVQAKVVEYNPRSRQAEEEAAQQNVIDMRERREQEQREQERREQQRQEQQKQKEQERQEQRERERQEEAERERRQAREREAERQRQQELEQEQQRLERQQRLEQALAEEEEFLADQQAREVARGYADVIRERIGNNWSRPPSARRGMECVLEIQLVPTGQVVDVTVVESSGNSAFDRSAEQAVRRVGRFEVVQEISTDVFERQFRRLTLKFRPEDLRL